MTIPRIQQQKQSEWRQDLSVLIWLFLDYHGKLQSKILERILKVLENYWWHKYVYLTYSV